MHGNEKHHEKHEIYASILDEAAAYIEKGYSIRMGRPGEAGSLISPTSLQVIYAATYG